MRNADYFRDGLMREQCHFQYEELLCYEQTVSFSIAHAPMFLLDHGAFLRCCLGFFGSTTITIIFLSRAIALLLFLLLLGTLEIREGVGPNIHLAPPKIDCTEGGHPTVTLIGFRSRGIPVKQTLGEALLPISGL